MAKPECGVKLEHLAFSLVAAFRARANTKRSKAMSRRDVRVIQVCEWQGVKIGDDIYDVTGARA
jgi:hypothetical protein